MRLTVHRYNYIKDLDERRKSHSVVFSTVEASFGTTAFQVIPAGIPPTPGRLNDTGNARPFCATLIDNHHAVHSLPFQAEYRI